MLAQLALGQLGRQDANGSLFKDAGLLALAAPRAVFGMNGRQEHRMAASARIGHHVQRDRLVDDRADAITDIATQAKEVEAGLMVDEHGDAHLCLVDVRQAVVQGAGRACLDAGNVLAHLARDVARIEKWRTRRHRRFRLGQLKRVVGTITHTHAATDAGAQKVIFGQRARRTQGERRQGLGLLGVQAESEAEHAHATHHLG